MAKSPRIKKNADNNEIEPAAARKEEGLSTKASYMKGKSVTIGKNIREHRKQRRFSVENLAEYLELSASYIGLVERGDRCPSMKIVFKLCDLFGVTPDALLTDKNKASEALHVAENTAEYAVKMRSDAIVSLIRTLNENEMDFVIDTIKNLRKINK